MSLSVTDHIASLAFWRAHPIAWIEQCLVNPETGQPFELLPAEREFLKHAFTFTPDGRLLYREWLYSCPKKSGKTTFEAMVVLTMTLLYGGAFPESYILANSQEQGKGRVFEICCRIVKASPLLKDEAIITADKLTFPAFNATVQAIPADAGSAAGTNSVCSGFDELWAYDSERARRLWDEMTPPPTRKIACRVTVTYAGYEGESVLLEELYNRGKQQPLVGDSLHAGDGLLMAWHQKPVAPWQDDAWLADMRRQRPSLYQRHVLNEFASSSSQFVEMAKWDRCTDFTIGHLPADPTLSVWVGVDASHKHDGSAVVVVAFDQSRQQARLVTHCVYHPTPDQPLDFEATIEAYLIDLAKRFQVRAVLFDPWQMQATAQRLTKAGLPLEEFAQTTPNLTRATQNLFDLIESQSIVLYSAADMRLAISRCVAIEGPRGWRIGKDKSAFKIDVIVALAMACHAAVQGAGQRPYRLDVFSPDFVDLDRRAPAQQQTEQQPDPRQYLNTWDWHRAMPKATTFAGDADENLRQLYNAIDRGPR
jgi:phage terminase large subunit-like protein